MSFPFTTRQPTASEVEAIRLMLSTYRDGSGTEREPDGTTRPNWRQIERVFAELFTGGPPPENKAIYDVIVPSLETPKTVYGLSIKSKQLSKNNFNTLATGSRTYMEVANSPAKMFDALEEKHGLTIEDFRKGNRPEDVGSCVLETVNDWHREGKATFERLNKGSTLDLANSSYITVSYRQWVEGEPRLYQIHSFPLVYPKVIDWEYKGKALKGYDPAHPDEVLFDWYAQSGGQLKYYPRADAARFSSPVFTLASADSSDLYEKAYKFWPDEWRSIQANLHPSLVRRNLDEV